MRLAGDKGASLALSVNYTTTDNRIHAPKYTQQLLTLSPLHIHTPSRTKYPHPSSLCTPRSTSQPPNIRRALARSSTRLPTTSNSLQRSSEAGAVQICHLNTLFLPNLNYAIMGQTLSEPVTEKVCLPHCPNPPSRSRQPAPPTSHRRPLGLQYRRLPEHHSPLPFTHTN